MQEWFAARNAEKKSSQLAETRTAHHAKPTPKDETNAENAKTESESTSPHDGDEHADHAKLASSKSVPVVPAARAPAPDAVTADGLMVDDETIRVADILEPIQSRLPALAADLSPESYWRKVGEIVRAHIVEAVAQHLIWRKAHQQMTDELKPQLEKAVERMEKDRINREFGGRETAYEKYLAKHGKTRDEVRERLRRTVLIDSYLRDRLLPLVPQPRKQELADYYQAHLDDFSKSGRREMFLIDVPVAAFLDLSKPVARDDEEAATKKARQTVDNAAEALKQGESFDAVAKKYNYGLHKEDGGNWGWITAPPKGQTAPLQGHWEAPSRKLFELGPGQTSEIVEAARSFFIVKVGQIDAGKTLSFQEAQPEITGTIRQQQFVKLRADFLQKELDRSTIGSLDEFMRNVLAAVPPQGSTALIGADDNREGLPSRSPRLNSEAKKPARAAGR